MQWQCCKQMFGEDTGFHKYGVINVTRVHAFDLLYHELEWGNDRYGSHFASYQGDSTGWRT